MRMGCGTCGKEWYVGEPRQCGCIRYAADMSVSSDNNLRIEPRKPVQLSDAEIVDLMPEQIPADYDGPLLTFARATIAAYEAKQEEA